VENVSFETKILSQKRLSLLKELYRMRIHKPVPASLTPDFPSGSGEATVTTPMYRKKDRFNR